MQEDVSTLFETNGINGSELLALSESGLEKMGVVRVGTTCLLLKEIKLLEVKSQDVSTLIEHSPYCFGKILDFLRMKHLHSMELMKEPSLPSISEAQEERFEKVVKYYFPGETSKLMLGGANSMLENISVKDAVFASFYKYRLNDRCGRDTGCTVNEILTELQSQGFSFTELETTLAVKDLCCKGHIYSTVDDQHFQLAE